MVRYVKRLSIRWFLYGVVACLGLSIPRPVVFAAEPVLLEGYTTILPQGFAQVPVAGRLVRVERTGDVTILGSLAECGVDPVLLRVEYTPVNIPRTVEHRGLMARLGVALLGIQIASAERLEIKIENAEFETVAALMALINSVAENPQRLIEKCGRWLFQPRVYWVDRAMRARHLSVQADTSGDMSIGGVKGVMRSRSPVLVGVSPDSSRSVNLEVNDLRYVALRLRSPYKLIDGQLAGEGTNAGVLEAVAVDDYLEHGDLALLAQRYPPQAAAQQVEQLTLVQPAYPNYRTGRGVIVGIGGFVAMLGVMVLMHATAPAILLAAIIGANVGSGLPTPTPTETSLPVESQQSNDR